MAAVRFFLTGAMVLGLAAVPAAAKQPVSSRPVAPSGGLRLVSTSSPGVSGDDAAAAAMKIGAPAGIAKCDSWITSDYEIDLFTSNYLWCEFENLQVVGGFFARRPATVRASVVIQDRSGHQVYAADGAFPVDLMTINYVIADVGALPPGFYRVVNKLKQGHKSVGQRFWLQVTEQTDPQCAPYLP